MVISYVLLLQEQYLLYCHENNTAATRTTLVDTSSAFPAMVCDSRDLCTFVHYLVTEQT